MPILFIAGINGGVPDTLRDELKIAVASVAELKIGPEKVTVKYLNEQFPDYSLNEIIVQVLGFSKKPERTHIVINKMAEAIQQTIAQYYPSGVLVECFVLPYAIGFSTNQQ